MKNICYGFSPWYTTSFKCIYSEEYYHIYPYLLNHFTGDACSDDPDFYQACDKKLRGKITNGKLLCEHFICEIHFPSYSELRLSDKLVGFLDSIECKNTDLNKVGCEDPDITLPSGEKTHSNEICDGECDVRDCEDEALCNGFTYGMWCEDSWENTLRYVPPINICNGYKACNQGEDEADCTVTNETEAFCYKSNFLVPVHNYTRCTEINALSYLNYYDRGIRDERITCIFEDVVNYQANCSDPSRIGVTCEIDGYQSSVSKYIICFHDTISACDDKIDTKCLITNTCRVHKHYMCDNNIDCNDMADKET